MKAAAILLIVFAILSNAFGQSPSERFFKAREAMNAHDYAAALDHLRTIEQDQADLFRANNLDYLTARLQQRSGNSAQAAAYFQKVRSSGSILREYATWHLAAIARECGNVVGERVLLLELLADRPGSIMADATRQRIAQSYFESKDYDAVIGSLSAFPGTGSPSRELQLLHAKALLFKNEKEAARQKFEAIIASSANAAQPDDLALDAVKAIDLIEVGSEQFGKTTAKLSDYEHLKRANIYQFNRDFADARLHFLAIVNDHPTSGLAPDAVYQIGRGYTQLREFAEAIKWYERVGEQHADHPVNKDATLQLASAYARVGRYHESVSRYDRFIKAYPDADNLDRAYLNIIDVLRDAGEDTDSVNRADKAAETFRGKAAEAQAIFAKARIRIARTEWATALADLDQLVTLKDLGGAGIPGGTTRAEVTFLRGLMLEELRRYPEAIDAYLSVPDGRNEYYGWLATERLRVMGGVPEAQDSLKRRSVMPLASITLSSSERRDILYAAIRISPIEGTRTPLLNDLKSSYTQLSSYKLPTLPKLVDVGRKDLSKAAATERSSRSLAEELAFLGLFDEAAPEYESSVRGITAADKKLSPEQEFAIASMYLKGDRADRAATFIEPLMRSVPSDLQPELLPLEITSMLYPIPYRDALLKHATTRGVDPRFLLSIMRQESRFRPNVKSVAAARGLMQFITDTSTKIAGELGRERFDQNELYYPPTAVLFGSQYVGNLFKLFPNQPEAVAASYNGGEDNMKRWLGRSKSDFAGRYVSEIGFAQSKDYVWRVMANYRMYQMLYDERLNPK